MPLRPARVAGGRRRWLATVFIAWVRDGSARRGRLGPLTRAALRPRGTPSATALMASVNDGAASPISAPRLFAVARPEALEERADLLCRRAILLGLRDAATA